LNIEGGDFEVQAVKWGDGIGNWDWEAVVQQFIPFTFKLYLPPLRKARIIIERKPETRPSIIIVQIIMIIDDDLIIGI